MHLILFHLETVELFPACGGSYNGGSGVITSLNYPDDYEDIVDCYYHITVEDGKVDNFRHYNYIFLHERHDVPNPNSLTGL